MKRDKNELILSALSLAICTAFALGFLAGWLSRGAS